jgi:DNA-binding IclR family transcriptional regulator
MKSLEKALQVLELFLHQPKDLSLGDISSLTGINKSSTYKIVSTLVQYGYLKQREKRGKYSLGTIYIKFSEVVKSRLYLKNVALPYLEKLSNQVHEVVLIAYGNGTEGVVTDTFKDTSTPINILRVIPDEGASLPFHSTCLGKILLAYMTEEEQEKYFNKKKLVRHTSKTITDINDLKNHLLTVKHDGVAFDYDELTNGVRGIASPIFDGEGKIAGAVSILAPSVRLTNERMHESAPYVKACAVEISRELGYDGNRVSDQDRVLGLK